MFGTVILKMTVCRGEFERRIPGFLAIFTISHDEDQILEQTTFVREKSDAVENNPTRSINTIQSCAVRREVRVLICRMCSVFLR